MDPSTENGRKVIAYVPREAELECIVQSLNWFVHVSVCFGWVNLNHSALCLYETRKTKACKKKNCNEMSWCEVSSFLSQTASLTAKHKNENVFVFYSSYYLCVAVHLSCSALCDMWLAESFKNNILKTCVEPQLIWLRWQGWRFGDCCCHCLMVAFIQRIF